MIARVMNIRWARNAAWVAALTGALSSTANSAFAEDAGVVLTAPAAPLAASGDQQAPREISDMETLIELFRKQEARLSQLEAEIKRNSVTGQTAGFQLIQEESGEVGEIELSETVQAEGGEGESEADIEEADTEVGGEDSPSTRYQQLNRMIGDLESAIDEVTGDDTIVHSGTPWSTMRVSGRIHADAWGFDTEDESIARFNADSDRNPLDPQNRLGFRRLRFGVKGDVEENMLYKIEIEFAGGNDVEYRDAYLGWTDLPILQTVLLGNQKRPYGLDHLNSSRYNVFLERPFVVEGFNEDARRLGLQSFGVSDDLVWNWRYGVFNQRKVQGLGDFVGDHLQLQIAGRLASTYWYDEISDGRGYAHAAISGTHAVPDDDAIFGNEGRFRTRPEARSSNRWLNTGRIEGINFYDLVGLESVFNVGPLQIVGEYLNTYADRENGLANTRFDGSYIYAAYFLTGEHMPWDRETGTLARPIPFQNFWIVDRCDGGREAGWGAWQVAARYSVADFSDEDVLGGEGEAWTVGLNWYWNANARMQFNYITGKIENRATTMGVESGGYNIFGARFGIDF